MVERMFVAAAAAFCMVTGCAVAPRVEDGLKLTVESFNPASGAYVLVLRNNTSRHAVFLTDSLSFRLEGIHGGESRVLRMIDDGSHARDAMLGAGESLEFTGYCTRDGQCLLPVYATVHACWFTAEVSCDTYLTIWSDKPLNPNRER